MGPARLHRSPVGVLFGRPQLAHLDTVPILWAIRRNALIARLPIGEQVRVESAHASWPPSTTFLVTRKRSATFTSTDAVTAISDWSCSQRTTALSAGTSTRVAISAPLITGFTP